jgi:RNA polymerase sigma-70 factor (ECF subfamily)
MPHNSKMREHDLAAVLTLDLLFRTEMDFVMNTARRCGMSGADAEDVAQQVFMALQRRLHTLQSPESVRPWLMTVTRRHASTRRQANRRDPFELLPSSLGEIEDDTPLAEEQLLKSERRREFLDLLEALEPNRRVVLVLHVLDEIPMDEVAAALGIPVPTAYNRLRLARADLRDAFARKGVADEYGFQLRVWRNMLTVRDPTDFFYGLATIAPDVRERLWARILEALGHTFPSIEAAEADGLRVLSPMWKTDASPRPYRSLKRRRSLPTRKHGDLPGLSPATESRTP